MIVDEEKRKKTSELIKEETASQIREKFESISNDKNYKKQKNFFEKLKDMFD